MDILTSEEVLNNFEKYLSAIPEDTPMPHGLCVSVDGKKVFVHFSTICYQVNSGELMLINTPSASKNFIKRCFFEAYCDTMEKFFEVAISIPPKNISGVKDNLLRITALGKKMKEGKWEICMKSMG